MFRIVILGLLVSGLVSGSPVITVNKDQGVTWKSLFDAGFRPKYQPGFERRNTLWFGPSFGTQVGDDGEVFTLGTGRLVIEIQVDNSVRIVRHSSDEKITFEEGERRVASFRKAFQPYIIGEITMPKPLDPRGTIDAGNRENQIVARVGEWKVCYGFRNSFDASRPLSPHFYIVHNFPGLKPLRVAGMSHRVKPPEGYEWYSLDPDVDTPDPGAEEATSSLAPPSKVEDVLQSVSSESESADLEQLPSGEVDALHKRERSWIWVSAAVITIFLVSLVWALKKRYQS